MLKCEQKEGGTDCHSWCHACTVNCEISGVTNFNTVRGRNQSHRQGINAVTSIYCVAITIIRTRGQTGLSRG